MSFFKFVFFSFFFSFIFLPIQYPSCFDFRLTNANHNNIEYMQAWTALETMESRLAAVGLSRDDLVYIQLSTLTPPGNTSVLDEVEEVYSLFFKHVSPAPARRYIPLPSSSPPHDCFVNGQSYDFSVGETWQLIRRYSRDSELPSA